MKDQDEQKLAARIAAGFVYHVAEDAGQIVGFVGMRERSHLYHLFVASHWHGRGLARHLWETARDEALRGGAPAAFTVNASNYAVAAYQALGFVRSAPPQCSAGLPFNPMRLALPDVERAADACHGWG
ncbi:MAG: GNAT family N-acetyltransferase [Pseudomonadota bacterium]